MRAIMSFALLLPFMVLSACEETAPDTPEQAEVRQAFLDWERACQTSQGDLAVSRIASRCFDHYDRLIDYATDGDRRTVLALRPTDQSEIVLMRNRITLQDLDRMDGRALLKHVVDQGWGYDPNDSDWFRLGAIQINGDMASAIMYVEGEKTGRFFDFYYEDGAWKIDLNSWDELWARMIEKYAREAGMSVDEFTLRIEAAAHGLHMEVTRWTPMRSW